MLLYGSEARKSIKSGIDKVANAVRVTIGPKGRNVVIDGFVPTITNDGVTIAQNIILEDKFENLGAKMIVGVAEKSNKEAGDGTTTSTIITQALVEEGIKYVESGMNPVLIRNGMEEAKKEVLQYLKGSSKKISSFQEVSQVATISSESKETGELIASLMEEIGKDGVVTIEQGNTLGITKQVVSGMSFNRGYISQYFAENGISELSDPYIIITDRKISAISEVVPILNDIAGTGKKEVVIIADDVDGEALSTLVFNKLKGTLNVLAVRGPEFGDVRKAMLDDIALLTGGQVISQDKGMKLEEATIKMLGKASKVISTKEQTTIVSGAGKKGDIQGRIELIKLEIEKSKNPYDTDKLKNRLARLSSGVGVITYGASTETEATYLKHKLEDAVNATQSAMEEGIVVGGGVALLRASNFLYSEDVDESRDIAAGYAIVLEAIKAPMRFIIENSGAEPMVVMSTVSNGKGNFGYNALTGEYEKDMFKAGIIDPLKVVKNAIENSVSVASLILTTECAISNDKKEEL